MKPRLITITGPSCAGKSTLMYELIRLFPETFNILTCDTTRPPRDGESGSTEYRFSSEEEFFKADLLQHVRFGNYFYGTRREDVHAAFEVGKCPVKVVEPTGVKQFKRICNDIGAEHFSVFVNQDPEVLASRWLERFWEQRSPGTANLFGERVAHTLMEEINWADELDYDFYYDSRYHNEGEMLYALSRIGTGKIPLAMARTIFVKVP